MARLSTALPRARLRSQVIVLPVGASAYRVRDRDSHIEAPEPGSSTSKAFAPEAPPPDAVPMSVAPCADETDSVHSAPTRELAAYVEELAALSMQDFPTRALAIHQATTRELTVDFEDPAGEPASLPPVPRAVSGRPGMPSGFQPRTRSSRDRREEDATLRMGGAQTRGPADISIEELLRMLGPSPVPDLGNIEIYYRLGVAYLAVHKEVQARRCFLTVEEISPGYRDAAARLMELPIYAPTSSGPTPVHHVATTSGPVPRQSGGTPAESELARSRRNGR